MAIVLFFSLLIFFALGVPIAIAMGLASAFALIYEGSTPVGVLAQRSFTSVDSFPFNANSIFSSLLGTLNGNMGGIFLNVFI